MPRPKIFISYSHRDENEKNELVEHLSVIERAVQIGEVWSDQCIGAGEDWKARIEQAMAECDVAIFLISRNFLISNFILNQEVPKLLTRRQSEGLVVVPVLAKPCLWEEVPWLGSMQIRPKDNKAVWREGGRYVDDELTLIVREVVSIIKEQQRKLAEAEQQARKPGEQEPIPKAAAKRKQRDTEKGGGGKQSGGINVDNGSQIEARDVIGRDQFIYNNMPLSQAPAGAKKPKSARTAKKSKPAPMNSSMLTLAPAVTLELVRAPAGEFLMGSDKLPQHTVYLDEFLIGKYPVTVAQFSAFVTATNYQTAAEQVGRSYMWTGSVWKEVKGANWQHPHGPKSDVAQKQNHPVTHISWDDAREFCGWASRVTKRKIFLPSEAQWEKAARGGVKTPRRGVSIYPWGDDPPNDKLCNFNMNVKDTTPVGAYSPCGDSPYSCADMAGNV